MKSTSQLMDELMKASNIGEYLKVNSEHMISDELAVYLTNILEKKGFVAHRAYGKSHEYYPVVNRKEYTSAFMTGVLNSFFGGSVGNMVSFLSHDKGITVSEADEIIRMLQNKE